MLLENNLNNNKDEFELYQKLIKTISSYIKNKDILDKINKSYLLAKEKHKNQKRITGEDFIIHPICVTQILADLKSEPNTLMGALLHDVLEDTDLTFDELKSFIGDDIANIVLNATKLTKIVFNQHQTQTDNQQKMFLAMVNDIRVVFLKLADRLHNMQTLQQIRVDKQKRISEETLAIYVPLSHRLGLFQIKSQLEDLAFRYINPQKYYQISHLIKIKKNEREKSINKIIFNIKKLFYDSGIKDFFISGRSKNIYSIYKKMQKRQLSFEEIFDLLAIRIVVNDIDSCYRCLGIIHNHYSPLPLRFKDYIAVPKPNLYQSLHNTVLSKDGTLFELQIRTKEMNEIAENGIASHWSYKEDKIYSKEDKQLEIAKKLKWYQELIKITKDSEDELYKNSQTFVNAIKNDILNENVYVFTPKQEVYEFPKGSTPIDFAFKIHSDIGFRMTGAIVNKQIVPLEYILQNGDIVSIKTNKNVYRVKKEWLKIVQTSYSKKIIKKHLNKENKDNTHLIKIGRDLLDKELSNHKIDFIIDSSFISQNFYQQDIQNTNELYLAIANKKINCNSVIAKINSFIKNKQNQLQNKISEENKKISSCKDTDVIVEGINNIKLKLANCCYPVFNEEIVGFISKNKGITIHRINCPNLEKYDHNKMISAYWNSFSKLKYVAWLFLIAANSSSLLKEINDKIHSLSINITQMNVNNNNKTKQSIIKFKILVNNIDEINKLIVHLSKLSNIYKIYRGII
ncbi:RelA/SpoT family protein [Candidatus Phytoplasma luffae]|uniref:RelA/SpoT family protein n=1 Tax=Loofah witches'-broom phytoplasma TaxID=35773 RepID=UPI001B38D9D2|nr:RelA/SpoT family protein [Candidatus Phytoplasma luffae]